MEYIFDLPNPAEYNITLKDIPSLACINKNLTSHVGRHTFGHMYLQKVQNLASLKELMGHTKIETTMRYVHLENDYLKSTANLVGEEFKDLRKRKRNTDAFN
ncbi:tyrosine-type recombinase/integrase [Mucilaginibacter litoreus]|uniref:Tyrosine-type recombinase/integrase n=1 Tax=Mucilaginibacter litoreus TaxID=1048221 RepID=A0ABW3AUS0_9SPHI